MDAFFRRRLNRSPVRRFRSPFRKVKARNRIGAASRAITVAAVAASGFLLHLSLLSVKLAQFSNQLLDRCGCCRQGRLLVSQVRTHRLAPFFFGFLHNAFWNIQPESGGILHQCCCRRVIDRFRADAGRQHLRDRGDAVGAGIFFGAKRNCIGVRTRPSL